MKKLSLEYLIKEPLIKLEKNPLLLLIHGYGSNETDLFSFANELPNEYFIVSVRAPYSLQTESYAWYAINFDANENKFSDNNQAIYSRDLIANFIDELLTIYPIDKEKVNLLGFSQGGILSYALALSFPNKIQKTIALSAYLNESILDKEYLKNDLSKLKIFASHGISDGVIPVEWARKSKYFLEKLGVELVYKEYRIGHGISLDIFKDFIEWLNL